MFSTRKKGVFVHTLVILPKKKTKCIYGLVAKPIHTAIASQNIFPKKGNSDLVLNISHVQKMLLFVEKKEKKKVKNKWESTYEVNKTLSVHYTKHTMKELNPFKVRMSI